MHLNFEQIGFFKINGYLIIPNVMDTALCEVARADMWAALPSGSRLQQHNVETHMGPFDDDERSTESIHTREGYRWLNRHLGVSQTVIDLVYSDTICAMADQLLGGELRQAVVNGTPMGSQGAAWPGGPTDPAQGNQGARGVYYTLPYGDKPEESDACHTDGHPFQLGIVGLLDTIPAGAGAFKVWPGSHKRLYPTFKLRYDQPRIPFYDHLPSFKGILHTPEYLAEIEALNENTAAVECYGNAGDIVFWHHRCAHMAGHNYSKTIRQAVLADFWKLSLDEVRSSPPDGDMWRDWSPAIQNCSGQYSPEFALTQGLS